MFIFIDLIFMIILCKQFSQFKFLSLKNNMQYSIICLKGNSNFVLKSHIKIIATF